MLFLPIFHSVTLQANLAALRLHFPGWILRLYVDHKSLDASTMDQLIDLGRDPAFDLCIGLEHQGLKLDGRNGMLWRFLPLLDNMVDVRKQLSGKKYCDAVLRWFWCEILTHDCQAERRPPSTSG